MEQNSNGAIVVAPKPKNPGSFVPGDERINRAGGFSKPHRGFGKQLREMLIEEGLVPTDIGGQARPRILKVIKRVYDEAEKGEAWACQLIFDRVDGKVPQTIEAGDVAVIIVRGASTDEL